MLVAYSVPVGLFLVLPYLLASLGLGWGREFLHGLLHLLVLLVPVAGVVFGFAPWAGRGLAASKVPAFLTGALAALSPLSVVAVLAALQRDLGAFPGVALMWAMFALPASVLGTLLFIGACQRLRGPDPG